MEVDSSGTGRGRTSPDRDARPELPGLYLTYQEVRALTTYSKVTLWRRETRDVDPFPARIRLGARKLLWPAGEVLDWIARQPTGMAGRSPKAPNRR